MGIGLAMPTFTLAVQNTFPARDLGAVTAAVQFFRSIGSTIGVALMGTFLTTRLTSSVANGLPPQVAQALPPGAVATLDPQALVSPGATRTLEAQFAVLPDGARLFGELMDALRLALATSVHDVFLVATTVAVGGVIVAILLPEKPLRGRQEVPALEEAGKELAVEGIGTAPPIPSVNEPRLVVAEPDDGAVRPPSGKLSAGDRTRTG